MPNVRKLRGPFICLNCASWFFTRRRNGEGEKYCSRDCAFEDKKRKPFTRITFNSCKECESIFAAKRSNVAWCSDACRKKNNKRRSKKNNINKHNNKTPNECLVCGTTFSRLYGVKDRACSDACRAKLKAKHKRIYKSKRRALIRGNKCSKPFDPFYVFERDKWRCQSCGRKTPQSLRGTYADSAPELDHIVPLSLGGEHSTKNTQCLCRQCNREKSNSSAADQMLLFG